MTVVYVVAFWLPGCTSTKEDLVEAVVGEELVDEEPLVFFMQRPSRRTKFLCWSFANRTTSFFISTCPCCEVADNLFTAISCPFCSVP
jgi:hypothetical protein